MENNALTIGVSPDGLKNKMEIKVLICALLSFANEPLTQEELIGIITERSLANYLELCSAFDSLTDSGSIVKDNDSGNLTVTDTGKVAADEMWGSLPRTVREKSKQSLQKHLRNRRNRRDNTVTVTNLPDGCRISCSVRNGQESLMDVSLYLPDTRYAEKAKERFFDDPEYIYRLVLSHLTGDRSVAPTVAHGQEEQD